MAEMSASAPIHLLDDDEDVMESSDSESFEDALDQLVAEVQSSAVGETKVLFEKGDGRITETGSASPCLHLDTPSGDYFAKSLTDPCDKDTVLSNPRLLSNKEEVDNCSTESEAEEEDAWAEGPEEDEIPRKAKKSEEFDPDFIDDKVLKDRDAELSEAEEENYRLEGQELKATGNKLFQEQNYQGGMECYTNALRVCPYSFAKDRAIMFSNRAACKLRLEHLEAAIEDSTRALELHPVYVKALLRRAELYEKTDKLDEAMVDYQKLIELDPGLHQAREACVRLPGQINERNEKMKAEMMDKLKDLGNIVLKPFGLSTDNFQLQQDPSTGSYSVNFQQKPP